MERCPGAVVVTQGIRGSVGCERGRWVRQAAFRVPAVDTTGAGDAFHTGYIYGLLKGEDLSQRLRLGAATAALKCMQPGARTGLPNKSRLDRFMRRHRDMYA